MSTSALLAGRVAVVTGGGGGIGRAVCQLFARNGACVAVVDRGQQGANETVASLPTSNVEDGSSHKSFAMDVTDANAVRNTVAEVLNTFQKPASILVNSAGIVKDNLLLKMKEQDFDDVVNVNLKGTFLMTQAFSQAMVQSKVPEGSIINIASIIGKSGNIGQSNYSASKAGVEGLTRSVAKELSRFNIRCNAVLPGLIDTQMTAGIPEKVLQMLIRAIPLGKMGKPEDVAELCLFLASSKSSYMTGTSIDVTGGLGL